MPTIRPTRGPADVDDACCPPCGPSSTNARNIWVLPAGSLLPWGPWGLAMAADPSESPGVAQVGGGRPLQPLDNHPHLRVYVRNTCLCQVFVPHPAILFACSNQQLLWLP